MDQTSLFSMGSDAADYNNDGYVDLLTLDMLAQDNKTQKMHSGAENFDKLQYLFNRGFYYQYSRNMLQKNNGDGTFSEVGQLSGVSNTDWSWAALFADYDNDGYEDLFITYYGKAYKAAFGDQNATGVMIQGQVLQDDKVLMQDVWRPLSSFVLNKEHDSIEFGGRLRAAGFRPGLYVLRVLVKEPQAKAPLQKETFFEIIP